MKFTLHRKVTSEINETEITHLLSDLRGRILQGFSKKLDFGKTFNMCDEDYHNLTCLSCNQFEDLVSHFSSFPKSTVQSLREATGLLLTKLRTGMSHSLLATLFGLSEIQVSHTVASARKAFIQNFVP
jgi:hypothetical protein